MIVSKGGRERKGGEREIEIFLKHIRNSHLHYFVNEPFFLSYKVSESFRFHFSIPAKIIQVIAIS